MRVMGAAIGAMCLTPRQLVAGTGRTACKTSARDAAGYRPLAMIDTFTLLLVHGLLLIAFYRLMVNDELDMEEPPEVRGETAPSDEGTSP